MMVLSSLGVICDEGTMEAGKRKAAKRRMSRDWSWLRSKDSRSRIHIT